jgi:hypothetical protein
MFKPENYRCGVINVNDIKQSSNYSVTVDTKNDLERTKKIFEYYKSNPLEIRLEEIIEIIDVNDLPNSKIEFSGSIKMPYGKEISFKDFQTDMNNRIKNSNNYCIE